MATRNFAECVFLPATASPALLGPGVQSFTLCMRLRGPRWPKTKRCLAKVDSFRFGLCRLPPLFFYCLPLVWYSYCGKTRKRNKRSIIAIMHKRLPSRALQRDNLRKVPYMTRNTRLYCRRHTQRLMNAAKMENSVFHSPSQRRKSFAIARNPRPCQMHPRLL
jgi:hypothetical protein